MSIFVTGGAGYIGSHSGKPVPYKVAPRRSGDVAAYYADPTLAFKQLGRRAERGLPAMCADTWRWQRANPNGYAAFQHGLTRKQTK